ncbi:MAG: PadR family transcriptional regulator [Candidatus Latescibacterota bacterium]|nr:MAG: PadR family transcriptional regulator [Candidatus Latescibacterota bacterium]
MKSKTTTRYAILGLLSIQPMSGYDMKQFVDMAFKHFWSESYGRLYPTLRQLETEGLLKSRVYRQRGRPDRRVHTITDKGRRELTEWLEQPASLPRVRSDLLLKLFFGHNVPVPSSIEQIRRQREVLETVLKTLQSYRPAVDEGGLSGDQRMFFLLTIRNGELVNKARIKWCDEAIKILSKHVSSNEETPS